MNEDKTYYLWITLVDECIFGFMYEIELDKLEDRYSSNAKEITDYKIYKLNDLKTFESHINNLKQYAANDKYDKIDRRIREIIRHEDERLFYHTLTKCLYKHIICQDVLISKFRSFIRV